VATVGEPGLVAACAPSGPGIEPVPLDGGGAPPDLVLALGGQGRPEVDAPVVMWLLDGERRPPDGLRPEDRLVASSAGAPDAWRILPLPVADDLFAPPVKGDEVAGRAMWLTLDGPRRRDYLERFDHSAELIDPPGEATVAINLHDEEGAARFEHRAARALAAGRLLVSETLVPSFGLEPGIDYLEARDLTDLYVSVENAARLPDAYRPVRLRGHRKAEWFRASSVAARLALDLRMGL
jgi:hypothetical protein